MLVRYYRLIALIGCVVLLGAVPAFADAPADSTSTTTAITDLGSLSQDFYADNQTPASHVITPGLSLGSVVGAADTMQTVLYGGVNSEDGVQTSLLDLGQEVIFILTATNTTGQPAMVQGWVDFDGNNRFDDDERIATNLLVSDGLIGERYTVAAVAPQDIPTDRVIHARFRISTVADLDYYGPAPNGEVEDYVLRVVTGLPNTGESPWWRDSLLIMVMVFIIGVGSLLAMSRRDFDGDFVR